MIIYNATVKIEPTIAAEWLEWMQMVHIPEVISTGLFVDYRISRLTQPILDDDITYIIQYELEDMNHLEKYQSQYAPDLQKAHQERYAGKFVAFRTVMDTDV